MIVSGTPTSYSKYYKSLNTQHNNNIPFKIREFKNLEKISQFFLNSNEGNLESETQIVQPEWNKAITEMNNYNPRSKFVFQDTHAHDTIGLKPG